MVRPYTETGALTCDSCCIGGRLYLSRQVLYRDFAFVRIAVAYCKGSTGSWRTAARSGEHDTSVTVPDERVVPSVSNSALTPGSSAFCSESHYTCMCTYVYTHVYMCVYRCIYVHTHRTTHEMSRPSSAPVYNHCGYSARSERPKIPPRKSRETDVWLRDSLLR